MSKLTPDELRAKYGMDNPPDPSNPHALAMLVGPSIVAESFDWRPGDDLNELFDPTRCPEMYAVAQYNVKAAHTTTLIKGLLSAS